MRINHVRIENFRSHKLTDIDLVDHHVLVGENGSGKTAVLEAINYATSPYFLSSRLDEQDFHSADSGDIKISVSFDAPFVVKIPDGYTSQCVLSKSITLSVKRREKAAPRRAFSDPFVVSHLCEPLPYEDKGGLGTTLPEGISIENLPESVSVTDQGVAVTRKSGSQMNARRDSISLSQENVGLPSVFYFDKNRDRETRTGFNSLLTKVVKDLNWRYRAGWSQEAALKAWGPYYEGVISVIEGKKKRDVLKPLRDELSRMTGEDFSSLELSLVGLEQPFAKAFLSLRDGSNQIELDGLGSGIAILAALLFLDQVSERSKGDLILLIDEPELHLHPQLQHALGQRIVGSNAQTIISTHSPHFVDISRWRGISRLTRHSSFPKRDRLELAVGPKTVEGHLDDIAAYRIDKTTFSSVDSELFFARRALLVEGPAEKYGLPRLASLHGFGLDQVTVVSCNGKGKIPHYAAICHAYEIPTMILFDLDDKLLTDPDNAKVTQAAAGGKLFHFETSFEAALGISAELPHKASRALEQIDALSGLSDVPDEICAAIAAIKDWAQAR